MPIATYHLVEDRYATHDVNSLLRATSTMYAEILDSPLARIRVFAQTYPSSHCAVAGHIVADGATAAPYFEFFVLAGRPTQQRHRLLDGFTSLVVDHLHCPRELVRGRAIEVDPQDWAIGGVPASIRRRAEIDARLKLDR